MATMASICWGLSNIAFEASNDKHFPNPVQRAFGFWGNYWAWTATVVQGDAFQWWLDVCHETSLRQFGADRGTNNCVEFPIRGHTRRQMA
jgi:hypothetical protein